jgi:PAS domain S-box-containing protein
MDKVLRPLRLLLVEDNPNDAELLVLELRRAGFAPETTHVETETGYLAALNPSIDIILSDFAMPEFSGLRALALLQQSGLTIPFIIVSGTIGEETAVAAMRSGAADYLLKDRLTRLGPAVQQALEQKRIEMQRKQADATLDRLRRHHELILNSAGEGIYGVDQNGQIVFANPKTGELLGWDPDALLGLPAHKTIHHSRRDGSPYPIESCAIHSTIRDGSVRRVTNDLLWRKEGKTLPVEYVSAPMKDETGRVIGAIVVFKDVTATVAAEARLKLQAEQYRLLFETNPNAMFVFASEGLQILAVNKAAVEQYGYSRDEFLRLTLKDLRAIEDVPELIKGISAIKSQGHYNGEFRHHRKDGTFMIVEVYSGPVVWEGVAGRIATAIDRTERKRAEERLREQAAIIDRAHDAIIVRNSSDQRIAFWNKGAERLYGWTAEEVVGHEELTTLADRLQMETIVSALRATGEFRGELKQLTRDGRELVGDVRATQVQNADGTPGSILIICADITEQKSLETQLLRAQRLESIGTLASGVAHDLNNVLTPILMCADVLRHNPDPKDAEGSILLIEQSARRGASIVKQVLTFARGVQGERVLIQPSHLIEELADIARRTFPKSIQVTTRYPEHLWTIQADPTQLHQVLLNLSVNARDAMPDGGELVISAENQGTDEQSAALMSGAHPGPHVLFQISDTGSGMSREVIDKMFDPFFTTKDVGKGTGLGLSTSLGIVKSHGGIISVRSEIGQGTTFDVLLPAQTGDMDSTASEQSTAEIKGRGDLILLVDDEPGILRVTKMILEGHDYTVLCAATAAEAIETFTKKNKTIRAVLTDMMLPEISGVALVRQLKQIKPDVVVIASSGHGGEIHRDALDALGVNHFIMKPYDSQTLLTMMQQALR